MTRRIRQLPPAVAPSDNDVFPVSQMLPDSNQPTTRAMTRAQLVSDLVAAVNEARAELTSQFAARDQQLADMLAAVQVALSDNAEHDAQIEAALIMVQTALDDGNGTTPYDLWLEAGNTGTVQDYLASMVGPQGPAGVQGPQGERGPQGEAGPVGADGPMGPTGANGLKGDAGEAGPTGSTGAVGPKGDKGDKGDAGPQGIQGIPGQTGAVGGVGPQGVTGSSGATLVGTAMISETAVIALSAGTRKVTLSAAGTVTTGNYLLFPVSATPANYGIIDCACVTNGQLQVTMTAPLLALGASYSIPVRVVRINT